MNLHCRAHTSIMLYSKVRGHWSFGSKEEYLHGKGSRFRHVNGDTNLCLHCLGYLFAIGFVATANKRY